MRILPGSSSNPSTRYAASRPAASGDGTLLVPPRVEHAQPLAPSWLLAVLAALLLAVLAAQAPNQSPPVGVAQPPRQTAPGPCGPAWQVIQNAGGFTVRTTGAANQANPVPCALPISARSGTLDVHAEGDGALLYTTVTQIAAGIPASGWYAVPVSPAGDALTVQPAFRGVDLTLTVVIAR